MARAADERRQQEEISDPAEHRGQEEAGSQANWQADHEGSGAPAALRREEAWIILGLKECQMHEHSEHQELLDDWIKAVAKRPSARQRDDVRHYIDWCRFYGLEVPPSGEDCADYLLDMLGGGVGLRDIERVAGSIVAHFEAHGCFLD